MRNFTKDHNELNWLFPDPTKDPYSGEQWFDYYEAISSNLLVMAYNDQETFTKDDMIDAFMKGASKAHQYLEGRFQTAKHLEELRKKSLETDKMIKELKDKLNL